MSGERRYDGITFRPHDGSTRVELRLGEKSISHLSIIPLTIMIGIARVRTDGIGGVFTEEAYRKQGFSRRVVEASVEWMKRGGGGDVLSGAAPDGPAALSVLFGIANFYEKFGYGPAGPEVSLHLTKLSTVAPMPEGWTVRACASGDLPTIQSLYERSIEQAVGAVVREPDGHVWSRLAEAVDAPSQDECRVVEDPNGVLSGYAWRCRGFWAVDTEDETPDALAIGEAVAAGPAAADALLAACRAWAVEEMSRRPNVNRVKLYTPLAGPLYAAATRQQTRVEIEWVPSGGFMARTLDVHRLLVALEPELNRRLRWTAVSAFGTLRLATDLGEVSLHIVPAGVTVARRADVSEPTGLVATAALPQQALAQLALGTSPPQDLLDRLEHPPEDVAREWLEILFPQHHPYMHLPDWI